MSVNRKPRIGLALGSGSARGWAHVGVIRALEQAGIRPDLVCGTSVGAMVGAAYAAGQLDSFEKWLIGMEVKDVLSFMDVSMSGGVLKGERLMDFFRSNFVDRPIEELDIPFGAVSTALRTGNEVWLREGSTVEAIRASIAIPALFTPVQRDGLILVDGALVNPVPVSLARAMGAEVVIAVDLNTKSQGHHMTKDSQIEEPPDNSVGRWTRKIQENMGGLASIFLSSKDDLPSLHDVIASSIEIMQVRISRSRMAGDPPDVIISPRLAHFGLFEYHRAKEAIEEGRHAVEAALYHLNDTNKLTLPWG